MNKNKKLIENFEIVKKNSENDLLQINKSNKAYKSNNNNFSNSENSIKNIIEGKSGHINCVEYIKYEINNSDDINDNVNIYDNNTRSLNKKSEKKNDEEIKQLTEQQNIAEKGELECAMKMSLALEEEEKKLRELEEAELEKAIKLSLLEQQQSPNPTPLIQTNPNLQIKLDNQPIPAPKPEEKKLEEKKPEEKKPQEKKSEELPKKLNPIDKVALKQKQLKEHDEKMKNIVQNKLSTVPVFTDKKNESLNKKLDEMEANKNKTLQEYREMILRMKKEKRHQEENEGTDILSYGLDDKQKGKEEPKLTEEEKQKMKNKIAAAKNNQQPSSKYV